MEQFALKNAVETVRASVPLVHNITNYVTVNDCANALLACGGSPIMSDEPEDVVDITSICGALTLNIGTLNKSSIEAMFLAGARAAELGHPIVLDPVGAGASGLRTRTAAELLDKLPIAVIRGNMSEVKALAGGAATTRGVDVCPDDAVTSENLAESAAFARDFAQQTGSVVAITGAIDIVAHGDEAYAVSNGSPVMGKITGAGCMLSCVCAAYAAVNQDSMLDATVAAVASMGLAGETAEKRMGSRDGNGSFRTYLLDALYRMDGEALEAGAKIERIDR
ncbi:hydroxyethylthiazole kinase [Raoultibacter timonensis]|uniref:Hydroxyethylthiazole kinase n=2 Tax=Raoultibacter timonensis TaxID=1907662 RepID=A0ABN6MHM1_9ACTN|nr:hydroxyethylthiazole kinase [Raoultibacter timonensis]BDE96713.1 hydroxyethylthiazole kinase [Raoultibacter timonensis]BDF51316.1 hydroxyethylthiazole kinase [Raoultibacter timonensis]